MFESIVETCLQHNFAKYCFLVSVRPLTPKLFRYKIIIRLLWIPKKFSENLPYSYCDWLALLVAVSVLYTNCLLSHTVALLHFLSCSFAGKHTDLFALSSSSTYEPRDTAVATVKLCLPVGHLKLRIHLQR